MAATAATPGTFDSTDTLPPCTLVANTAVPRPHFETAGEPNTAPSDEDTDNRRGNIGTPSISGQSSAVVIVVLEIVVDVVILIVVALEAVVVVGAAVGVEVGSAVGAAVGEAVGGSVT